VKRLIPIPLVACLFVLGACSTSRRADVADTPSGEDPLRDLATYEDFEPSGYEDTIPVLAGDVQHDVPEVLMASNADDSLRIERRVPGFRVQIHSSLDKEAAVAAEEEVMSWWRAVEEEDRPDGVFEDGIPVYLRFYQPYYRVRVGDFAARDLAEQALRLLQREFPRAFIAVDTVTVRD
jgi:hypothetical protein